jgi:hypothetical protein
VYDLIQAKDLPQGLRRAAPSKVLGKLPIRDLLPGQALRVPLAHLSEQERRRAYGALRVRATRASQATGGTYSTHLNQDTLYVTRLT